jgi:hypothetical protein
MHTRKGWTLENEFLFVTVRAGYTELIMVYHPKGTGYRKYQDMHFAEKPQGIRASKVFYLNQPKKMGQRSALHMV